MGLGRQRIGRVLAHVGLLAFGTLLGLMVLEGGFRIAGRLVAPVAPAAVEGSWDVVLCVGDSHTYGMGKGYPAWLGTRLAQRSARWRVVNLGIPGANTAITRHRLPRYFDTYTPRIVVLWAGVNNAYNRSETEDWAVVDVPPPTLWQRLLDDSRLLRFVRVWRRDARLREQMESAAVVVSKVKESAPGTKVFVRRELEGDDVVVSDVQDPIAPQDLERVTQLDVEAMAAEAARRHIPMVVITYPLGVGWFHSVNAGIHAAAAAAGIPVVEGAEVKESLERRGIKPQLLFDDSAHPTPVLYDAIADRVLATLDEHGWLSR